MLRTAFVALPLIATPALAEQFSIRCTAETVYFLTFDTNARQMVWEAVQGGTYRGRIDAISDTEIGFSVPVGRDKVARAFFMRKEARVDALHEGRRMLRLSDCVPAPTRDVNPK